MVFSDLDLINALNTKFPNLIGQEIHSKKAAQIEDYLTAHLRNSGFILSRAMVDVAKSNKDPYTGQLVVTILPGFIDQVLFEGEIEEHKFFHKIRKQLTGSKSNPFQIKDLERYILLLNDLPGIGAQAYFKRLESTLPGASSLIIKTTKAQKVSALVGVNNRGNTAIGPYQVDGVLGFNNVLGFNEAVQFRHVRAFDTKELEFYYGQLSVPLTAEGLSFHTVGSYSQAEPGLPILRLIEQKSESWAASLGLTYPIIRTRNKNLTISFDLFAKETESTQLGFRASKDSLRVVRGGLDYDFADSWGGVNKISAILSKGFDGFGATPNINPTASRTFGRTNFEKINISARRSQQLTGKFHLNLAAKGQYSGQVLLSSEECGIGGGIFGRAFDSSELTGEHCAAASIELSYRATPVKTFEQFDPYIVIEGGKVWDRRAVNEPANETLSSVGAGVRFSWLEMVSGTVEVALPLNRDVASKGNDDARVFFSLTKEF